MINFGIIGASGRMGQTIARLSLEDRHFQLIAAIEHENHPQFEKKFEIPGRKFDFQLTSLKNLRPDKLQGMIDFSLPVSVTENVRYCEKNKIPIVIGTTGYSDEQLEKIKISSSNIPILLSSNMSIGVNMLFELVRSAASSLRDKGFSPEITEIHHRHKKDAPSGTAKSLYKIIQNEYKLKDDSIIFGREGETGERPTDQMGVFALRGGDVVGDHTVYFIADGERIELKHQAHTRDTFAAGALKALQFIVQCRPGLYGMRDVLQLK